MTESAPPAAVPPCLLGGRAAQPGGGSADERRALRRRDLERWNVVNRVLPDDQLLEKGLRFGQRLADGPTVAHAATKRIIRAYRAGGVDEADRVTPEQFAELFASEDLQGAVKSFLSEGPGKATFKGR